MRISKLRTNSQWVIPNTYVRSGGNWVLINNYIRNAGNWDDEVVIYITSNTTNVDVASLFESTYPGSWRSNVKKRLVINPGVVVGPLNASNYALSIPSGFGKTVTIENYGSIQGAGGAANSGTGGSAIFAGASGILINNLGTIYAGGGGGGQGGDGGSGSFTTSTEVNVGSASGSSLSGVNSCNSACSVRYGAGSNGVASYCGGTCTVTSGPRLPTGYNCSACFRNLITTTFTVGGAGGAGGVGQGYNQTLSGGAGGGAGGTNAGTGGTGGTGGNWGASGDTGGTGSNGNVGTGLAGAAGGLAGFYIVGNSNVSWISTGSVAGRVG
jgi:hypothetical protein